MAYPPDEYRSVPEVDAHYLPQDSLLAMARAIFLKWELLRIAYNALLVVATILLAGPSNLLKADVLVLVIEGAVIANILFFAGPIAETYIRWLGLNQAWIRWALLGGGTILTVLVAAFELHAKLSPPTEPTAKLSTIELSGPGPERIGKVTELIASHTTPPSPLLDAQLFQEKLGDGMLGPADYRTFWRVDVAPADVPKWTQALTPLANQPSYPAPSQHRDWWVSRQALGTLQFYEPKPLTGRQNGWIGVESQSGRIYIYTFTM
ncbi:MAG TPA: hypothetical protein VGJ26_08425 [Pirellulales bacterium]|jgi:hypothetical protein